MPLESIVVSDSLIVFPLFLSYLWKPLPVETNHWKRQYSLQRTLPSNKNSERGSRSNPTEEEQRSNLTRHRTNIPEEAATNSMDEVELRKKSEGNEPKVRVSIGTFEKRREPSKLDYLPTRSSVRADTAGSSNDISAQLREELTQTFSRARLRQRIPDSVVAEGEFSVPISVPEASNAPARPVSLPAPPTTSSSSSMQNSLIIELKSRTREKQEVKEDKKEPEAAPPSLHPTVIIIEGSTNRSTNGSTNQEVGALEGRKKTPIWPTFSRKPSTQIQAKMASLKAAAASATPAEAEAAAAEAAAAVVSRVSPPAEGTESQPPIKDSISQSADNKITIQINPYVSSGTLRRNWNVCKYHDKMQ